MTAPEVKTLPPLNVEKITAEAQAWVRERLHGLTDPVEIAKASSKIKAAEDATAEKWRQKRNAAAYALKTRYRLRRGADLAGALGMQRSRLMVVHRKTQALVASGHTLPHIEDPVAELPTLAARTAKHQGRADAANQARTEAVWALIDADWSNKRIADLIGVHPSQVSHIKNARAEVA